MPRVLFTPNLEQFLACPPRDVEGATVADALEAVFEQSPEMRSYVLDEQGRLRKHMNIFVDGRTVTDKETLTDSVSTSSEIFVMQALSGGADGREVQVR